MLDYHGAMTSSQSSQIQACANKGRNVAAGVDVRGAQWHILRRFVNSWMHGILQLLAPHACGPLLTAG